ncbi:SusC/RagA family TonB-linked outer membrane protein [Abyssalbus ytuae]|uniref:TonB-dependent receptor n=1 Tax=Abyssalbus ytuae TaxID=2926907 RepID=A0A9E6ZVX1_9FLAO|nr:TonB-dependent receptor [Abyssalbus ytuae]UOB17776.1 TonB-dependent receptor [Abyssalbus ytuae]
MKKYIIFLMYFIVYFPLLSVGYAQEKVINGTVTDETNVPMPGVNLVIEGTRIGTSTDFDGYYTLEASEGQTISVTYIGYESVRIVVGEASTYNIALQESLNDLDEVVVVGYGTVKKSDITGSIVQVHAEEINEMPVQNALQGIQGKAAGVDITSNARPGEVGIIRIRGNRSIDGSNDPLYVVDGVPLQSGGLEMLNTQDISSIEVLKDASATAIYGSRGANGVVLITTKKGRVGRAQISYDTSISFEKIENLADYFNAGEYVEYRRDALRSAGLYHNGDNNILSYADPQVDFTYFGADPTAWNNILNGYTWVDRDNLIPQTDGNGIPIYNPDNISTHDWGKDVERTGIMYNHNLSVSMGTDKVKAYLSGGYIDQKGTVAGQAYKRYTGLMNLELQAADWFTVGGTLNYNYSIQDYGYAAGGSRGSRTLYEAALGQYPFASPYDSEGNYIFNPGGSPNVINPIRDYEFVTEERTISRTFGSFFGEIRLAEGLRLKSIFGPDIRNFRNGQFQTAESSLRGGGSSSSTNYARLRQSQQVSWTLENLLYYDKAFNDDHVLGVTLLQSSSYFKQETSDMTATNLPYDSQLWYNLQSTNNGELDAWSSGYTKKTLTSYMGRINYSLMDKYLLTVSGRADGASVLSDGNKWDFFPSLAVAWKVENESFMKEANWINQFKLRFGIGNVGNAAIEPYSTAGGLVLLPYVFGDVPANGYVTGYPSGADGQQGSIPNKNLGWERTEQWNLGLDFGLFSNRISGSIDCYVANTHDILLSKTPNSVTGYGSIIINAGKTKNTGIEVVLSTVNIQNDDFRWTSDITFTKNKSEIVELVNGKEDDINNLRFIGQPIDVFYDYKKIGIWQTDDAAEMQVYNDNGADYEAGDIRVEDVNNDGIIDPDNDRQILGSGVPDWTAGLVNTFYFKNFELTAFLYSRWGHMVEGGAVDMSGQFVHRKVDYWTPDNPTNAYPKADYLNSGQPVHYSTMNYQDGSFIKLRYVTLGYNFPVDFTNTIGISNLKLYAQAINPWAYYKTDFLDSDSSFQNSGDNNSTSSLTTKSFVFGLNVTF